MSIYSVVHSTVIGTMRTGGGIEFEAKFLDIDAAKIRLKLKSLGAKLIHGRRRYVRSVYHRCTNEIKGFARVRDEGGKVTMTVKTYADPKFPEETEINVSSSYEEATKFMTAAGLRVKAFQETYREKWSINDPEIHEITLDDVPGIPTYMEIDCTTESKLNEMIELFKLDKNKMRFGAFDATYEEYYGVPKSDINDNTPSLTFANIEREIKPRKNHDLLKKVAFEQSKLSEPVGGGAITARQARTVKRRSVRSKSRSKSKTRPKSRTRGRK